MVLDNEFCVEKSNNTKYIKELKDVDDGYSSDSYYEVAYFRKCWCLRNDIVSILGGLNGNDFEYNVSKENLDKIIMLFKYYNADNWEDSIWDWNEDNYNEYMKKVIDKLIILRNLMDKYDLDGKVFFYDSY